MKLLKEVVKIWGYYFYHSSFKYYLCKLPILSESWMLANTLRPVHKYTHSLFPYLHFYGVPNDGYGGSNYFQNLFHIYSSTRS